MIVSLDLDQAINAVWEGELDWEFKKNWAESDRTEFPSLHDQEAGPATPFPYCVVTISEPSVQTRMSGHSSTERHEIHDVPVMFQIFAREMSGSGKSAKVIAGELADQVLMRFGGHPTVQPKAVTLASGHCLLVQYQSCYGTRLGDDEHLVTINYLFRLDLPQAA